MSLDFLLRADTREDFEAMAKSQGFMDEDGNPAAECLYDPTPGTPEYETGIPIPTNPQPVERGSRRKQAREGEFPVPTPIALLPGYHVNCRVWGALEAAQIEPFEQVDEDGNPLPLRDRTTFGAWMTELGTEGTQQNLETITTFVTASGVSFIDPESVRTRQRVWQ